MSLLPRDTARYRMQNLRLLVPAVLILFIGAGFASEAGAQSSTTLRLIKKVAERGGQTFEGEALSKGTQVAVLSSKREGTPHAFSKIDFGREDLEWGIREGSAKLFRLTEGGKTPETFEETDASGSFYYVLALTNQGELLESYVYDESRGGYYPGFDRVVSGNMKMGPVPAEYQDSLRAALESAMGPVEADTADGSQAGEDTAGTSSPEEKQKRSELEDGTSGDDSKRGQGYLQVFLTALYSWYGGVVLGLLIGGIGAWGISYWIYSKKISGKKGLINTLRQKLQRERKKEDRKVTADLELRVEKVRSSWKKKTKR